MKNLQLFENFGKSEKPAGLSVEETTDVANRLASAMSKFYKKEFTVNMETIEEDSFDLDEDGEEFAGGSYNIYKDGSVVNKAIPSQPNYGHYESTVNDFRIALESMKDQTY